MIYQEILEEGLERGIQQGIQQGEFTIVVKILTRKLGTLPSQITHQIAEFSLDKLNELTDALLEFQDLADLYQWLEANG